MKKSIFKEDRKYTFSDYFNMSASVKDIVAEFGYSFYLKVIDLPRYENYDKQRIRNLKETYYTIIPKIPLTSEMAKREFLISPLLIEVAKALDITINVEYFLEIDDKLSGVLDYFIESKQELLVIEAKNKDLDCGFTQLAVELIALDKYEENDDIKLLYGAVTTGDVWKFAVLERESKMIFKNIDSYNLPSNTEELFVILMGIVSNSPTISNLK